MQLPPQLQSLPATPATARHSSRHRCRCLQLRGSREPAVSPRTGIFVQAERPPRPPPHGSPGSAAAPPVPPAQKPSTRRGRRSPGSDGRPQPPPFVSPLAPGDEPGGRAAPRAPQRPVTAAGAASRPAPRRARREAGGEKRRPEPAANPALCPAGAPRPGGPGAEGKAPAGAGRQHCPPPLPPSLPPAPCPPSRGGEQPRALSSRQLRRDAPALNGRCSPGAAASPARSPLRSAATRAQRGLRFPAPPLPPRGFWERRPPPRCGRGASAGREGGLCRAGLRGAPLSARRATCPRAAGTAQRRRGPRGGAALPPSAAGRGGAGRALSWRRAVQPASETPPNRPAPPAGALWDRSSSTALKGGGAGRGRRRGGGGGGKGRARDPPPPLAAEQPMGAGGRARGDDPGWGGGGG